MFFVNIFMNLNHAFLPEADDLAYLEHDHGAGDCQDDDHADGKRYVILKESLPVIFSLEPDLYFYCIRVWELIVNIPANESEPGVRFSDGTFPVSTNHRQGFQGPIRKQDYQLCPPPYPGL